MAKIFNVHVSGITDDSRKVAPGFLFVAVRGLNHDGHEYIPEAIKRGASLIVGEKAANELQIPSGVIYKQVKKGRAAIGTLASEFFGHPSRKLKMIGVTGTDGKTTTVSLIYHILKSLGKKVGLISTVSAQIGNKEYDTGFHVTSPEPIALQEFLAKMVAAQLKYAVLEVTSHGIDQERIVGIHFDIGVLTNITHEHLDYHGTFEAYRDTKLKFLKMVKKVVLNRDDPSFDYLSKNLKGKEVFSYGPSKEFQNILPGKYNEANLAAAVTTVELLGIGRKEAFDCLKSFKLPTGRLEKIENDRGIEIYVDFAHTPNALEEVLTYLAQKKKGKLIVVFGAAGERDATKRPMMGEAAGRLADLSILTAEDPRSEEPEAIISQIAEGVKKTGGRYLAIPERGEAIAYAIQKTARAGDTIVICGKGHEKSMAYGSVEYPWSDQEAVKAALAGEVKKIKR